MSDSAIVKWDVSSSSEGELEGEGTGSATRGRAARSAKMGNFGGVCESRGAMLVR